MNITKIGLVVAVLGAIAAGCGDPKNELEIDSWREGSPPSGGLEAVARGIQMMGIVDRPAIHWYAGAGLDCPDAVSWLVTAARSGDPYDQCVRGAHQGGVIAIAAPAGMTNHLATIAHELGHVLAEEQGIECRDHSCAIFASGGEVDTVTATLQHEAR